MTNNLQATTIFKESDNNEAVSYVEGYNVNYAEAYDMNDSLDGMTVEEIIGAGATFEHWFRDKVPIKEGEARSQNPINYNPFPDEYGNEGDIDTYRNFNDWNMGDDVLEKEFSGSISSYSI